MKLRLLALTVLTATMSLSAWADAPCKPIMAACEAHGFYKGGASEQKGLLQDCMKPITEGKQVAGIKIDPKVASACKAKLAASGY